MNWNAAAVLLTAWSLATVNAILDSTGHRHWDDGKPDEADRYPNDNMLKTYVVRGGNKHFVTSVFPEMDARGFHEYVFDGLQPDFQWPSIKFKRNYYPQGITSRGGFSDDIFHQSFGMFEPLKRSVSRTSPSVANLLRRLQSPGVVAAVRQHRLDAAATKLATGGGGATVDKRRPEMDANGFHGDSFTGGMDHFDTMKRRPEMDANGFHGDSFMGGMDRFDTMKRRPEMDANGFHGDSFMGGMDRFDTMKRRPEMDANGFHGDSFTSGMDRFDTMKRRPEMDATGFEDSFGSFGRFETMKRDKAASPSLTSSAAAAAAAAARFNP